MDILSREELRTLLDRPPTACVSLFLPTQGAEPASQQGLIRLENLIRQAEERLLARGLAPAPARALLAPALRLLGDRPFWSRERPGVAIFVAPELFRVYSLPLPVDELVVVDYRFHVTPLLPLLGGDGVFYLLSIGLKGARLMRGSRFGLSPVELRDVPASLPEALKYDDFAKQSQLHSSGPGRGAAGAVFHGQGAYDGRAAKEEILRYFQQIDRGVRHALRDEHAPLVLAGVAYLLPIYRAANGYAHLVEPGIASNPDDLTPAELHARAWAIVAPGFERERSEVLARYQQLSAARPALATSYMRAIVAAAQLGRVEHLLVAAGARQWGYFEPESGLLTLHDAAEPRDQELVDFAAAQTILHHGMVYTLPPAEIPGNAALAAILRY